jgi:hypothetical protein
MTLLVIVVISKAIVKLLILREYPSIDYGNFVHRVIEFNQRFYKIGVL